MDFLLGLLAGAIITTAVLGLIAFCLYRRLNDRMTEMSIRNRELFFNCIADNKNRLQDLISDNVGSIAELERRINSFPDEMAELLQGVSESVDAISNAQSEQAESAESVDRELVLIRDTLNKQQKAIEDLTGGIVPDFEAAKAAVKAVNDFNLGLTSVMGYDPIEAARAARKRGDDE